jgi:uncharacterized Ntn-hydrolase superfamily protein
MTYSIVARDPSNGQMGVATQSQAFAVGSSVAWAMAGHGVIATQSMGEPMYGQLGLEMMRSGLTANEALTALRRIDPHPERRQVAMIDPRGRLDVYTGEACVAEAGHHVGDGCVALANMMTHHGVWCAMTEAFDRAEGTLALRMLEALRAAEGAGGDVRGRRSAAILVVCSESSGRPWRDHIVDLRVDDHADPVGELARLMDYNTRYHRMVEAFELAMDDRATEALDHLGDLSPKVDDEPELALWHAVILAKAGREGEAAAVLRDLNATMPHFVETARRFRSVRLVDPDLLGRILPKG